MNTKYAAEIWILQTQILLKLPTKMPIYGGNRRYANFAEICKKMRQSHIHLKLTRLSILVNHGQVCPQKVL